MNRYLPLLGLLLAPLAASAGDVVQQLRLFGPDGQPIDGVVNLSVELVDDEDNVCHPVSLTGVQVDQGYVSVSLGDVPATCVTDAYSVAVTVDGVALLPRLPLSALPRVASADHVGGVVDLYVAGELSAGCTPTGRLAYDTGLGPQVCVDGTWRDMGSGAQDGSVAARAARTCDALHQTHPDVPSGAYWLDPDGDGNTSDAWLGWCDMDRNGGGWTLVMQNVKSVTPNPTPTFAASATTNVITGGPVSSGLASFDLIVALDEWIDIGSEGRLELGTQVNVPSQVALYESVQLYGGNYQLYMAGETLPLGGSSPGWYAYHNTQNWSARDDDNDGSSGSCSQSYGNQAWWYNGCWSGSLWGHNTSQGARWTSSANGTDVAWGAIWLR